MCKILMIITCVNSSNSAKLIRTVIGQFLKGNIMGTIKIDNGRNYAHAQNSSAYNFC